jgi:cellulose synthase/poly-beta-1,6-N-acetylglucosamine synthase-like glycosyltransferase
MKLSNPLFSVIIPVRVETDYLRETVKHLNKQSLRSFEMIVITDKISKSSNPAFKRNLGASMSHGKYLAFLDDDSYPQKNWLRNANRLFKEYPDIASVCGPCLTPPMDNRSQKASGLVWSSFLGSGGAGTYRNSISSKRFVDDYPTVNLIVRKDIFDKVGGFKTHHWPGEDTILCLDIVHHLHQKILYHPSVRVFHHRRSVIIPHLKQITRYALHRGNFARIYPKTSLKIGYLIPSLFFIYLSSILFTRIFIPLYLYAFLLLLTYFHYLLKGNSLLVSSLAIITIPLTHIYYGILFIIGFFTKDLDFIPHQTNEKGYIGG